MKKLVTKFICLLVIFGLNLTGVLAVGETFSHFNDTDTTVNNTFAAGTLNISADFLNSGFETENINPGDSTTAEVKVRNQGSLGLKYDGSFEKISGSNDLCQSLELEASLDGDKKYDGSLSDFNFSFIDLNSSESDTWNLEITLPTSSPEVLSNETCHFNLNFNAKQQTTNGGFTDQAKIEDTIETGEWETKVVMNEFLPNANQYSEFIELYNRSNTSIDLDGFYIKADSNKIPINENTTNRYSGTTTIPANGWLVVVPEDTDKIDDSSGTISFYNPNDIEIDSYSYNGSDHNVDNTPGATNNLVGYWPFDKNEGDIAYDKSGNGNDGSINGATWTTGKVNPGLSFEGSGSYVDCGSDSTLDFKNTDNFTLSLWTKKESNPSEGNVMGLAGKNIKYAIDYYFEQDKIRAGIRNEDDGQYMITTQPPNELLNWTHIVFVYESEQSDGMRLYVNGDLKASRTTEGLNDFSDSSRDFEISGPATGGNIEKFNGKIDEVKLYDRVLSADEISEHYNKVNSDNKEVPEDKSYARIPDGSLKWVDPIPTPGGVNIKEKEESEDTKEEDGEDQTDQKEQNKKNTGNEENSSTSDSTTTNETTATTSEESASTSTISTSTSTERENTTSTQNATNTESTSSNPIIKDSSTTTNKKEESTTTQKEESSTTEDNIKTEEEDNASTTEESDEEENKEEEKEVIEEEDKSVEEEDKKEKEPAKLNDDEPQDDDEAQDEDESSEDKDESEDEDNGNSNEENSEKEDNTDETNNEN